METYRPAGWLETLVAAALRTTLRALLKPVFSPRWSIAFQRRWLSALARISLVPRSVSINPGDAGGVPGEWLRHGDVPAVREQLTHMGLTVGHMNPAQLAAREQAYTRVWRKIIQTSGFQPQ